MRLTAGLTIAVLLAVIGQFLSELIGVTWMGLEKSPVSAIMIAILLGVILRNTLGLPEYFKPGVHFGVVRVLRLGIVLLGLRLSLEQVGEIGLLSLPVILGAVVVALYVVTVLSRRIGMTGRLGTLIAIGTSVCGATAIVAASPAVGARDDEVAYSVACITLFGIIAMLVYPFAAHWMFDADPLRSGLFLGTSVHETAQVAGAALVYQEYYSDSQVLEIATVTKLVRNLGMVFIIPLMTVLYRRGSTSSGGRGLLAMIPLFVVGFAAMSVVRTVGDLAVAELGFPSPEVWYSAIGYAGRLAELLLAVAMASVGLGTSIRSLIDIGLKPLGIGLFSALIVGGVSAGLIVLLN